MVSTIIIIIIIIIMFWAVLGDTGTMHISIPNEKFCSFSDKNANN